MATMTSGTTRTLKTMMTVRKFLFVASAANVVLTDVYPEAQSDGNSERVVAQVLGEGRGWKSF